MEIREVIETAVQTDFTNIEIAVSQQFARIGNSYFRFYWALLDNSWNNKTLILTCDPELSNVLGFDHFDHV